ncbi:MAG: hypothetical protein WCP91_03665 [Candidatus Berkelbacteria bacterium]
MSTGRWICVAAAAIFVLALAAFGVREIRHRNHYRVVEKEGKLLAELSPMVIHGVAGREVTGSIEVRNIGSLSWVPQKNYFALGVFERSPIGTRTERLMFSNGANRLVVEGAVNPKGKLWKADFVIDLPDPGKYILHFQMVEEGVTWFGQEVTVPITISE